MQPLRAALRAGGDLQRGGDLEELAERRPLYAFRGLLQAAGYAAEVGHDVVTSDAISFLRNAIEDVITRRDDA